MADPRDTLVDFVLTKAAEEPPLRKAKIYRALAEYIGNSKQAAHLRRLAAQLVEADRACREFHFAITTEEGAR